MSGSWSAPGDVQRLQRQLAGVGYLAGDELAYTVDMAAVGQPLQRHLVALLHRED